jgi:hypothetical protein
MAWLAVVVGAYPAIAKGPLLTANPPMICEEIDGGGQNCEPMPLLGWDQGFCRPVPGLRDWILHTETVGSEWVIQDCTTGDEVNIVVRMGDNFDLLEQVIRYRDELALTDGPRSVEDIAAYFAVLGSQTSISKRAWDPANLAEKGFCPQQPAAEDCVGQSAFSG